MKLLKRLWYKVKFLIGYKVKFKLTDIDDNIWDLSESEIHTIILDTYTIYIIYKIAGGYKTFQNTLPNRSNLPNIRLGQELKFKS